MEVRGAAAQYEPSTGEYTVWMTSQDPHIMRLLMTAFVFGIPETKMRCIALHVGGGFGTKIFLYHEYVLMAALAAKVGRPVKWVETRSENYTATTHGRDHITYLDVGAKKDGTITALKAKTYANLGGVLSTIAPGIPTTLYGRMLSGAYRIPNIHCQVLGVYTNTGMVDAYRGAGRPEATYVVERAVDLVARELDLDPVEVRRATSSRRTRSRTTPASCAGSTYDTGDYEKALDRALEIVDYDGFRDEQEQARADGRHLGIGFSTYVEICGVAPSAWIGAVGEGWGAGAVGERQRPRPPDRQGRRHDRLPAARAGPRDDGRAGRRRTSSAIPIEDVTVEHGDTLGTPFGYGTYGSRSAAVGGDRRLQQRPADQGQGDGASRRTCSRRDPDDVVYEDGKAFVKGVAGERKDDPGDRGCGRARATTCPRARSRSSTTRPTTTRRTARSRSGRTSRWSRSTPRRAR